MPKRTISPISLPSEATDLLHTIALAVRQARFRRRWPQRLLAEKAGVSTRVVQAIEAGRAGTSAGHLLAVLWALRLTAPLHALGDPASDHEGRALAALASSRQRARAPRGSSDLDTEF